MKLLLVVNVDWFFLSHRLPIALGALQSGYEVHVATTVTRSRSELESYGFVVHPIRVDRSGTGPLDLLRLFISLLRLFWIIRPDVLHLVTIKPVLIGGLAARLAPVRGVVYAVSGLGHVFLANGFWGASRRKLVRVLYRLSLGVRNMRIIFQNPDDQASISSIARVNPDAMYMIPGSGVDLSKYNSSPLPDGTPVVMMAARLLATKGVREFVDAAQILRTEGVKARFWLVGDLDIENPASIQRKELDEWKGKGLIELMGYCKHIPELMNKSHIVVLPSYREGLPKVLIEAAACGRAVVTTDVPGCRDAIEDGVTGLIVPAKDSRSLAQALRGLIESRELCQSMGSAGRARAERIFDVGEVVVKHLEIYQSLGGRT